MKLYLLDIYQKYLNNHHQRILSFALLSLIINILIGVFKLSLGLFYGSIWLLITASYYILLSIIKGIVLTESVQIKTMTDGRKSQTIISHICHKCGKMIILLGLFYFILCLWMYLFEETIVYPEYILYGVVAVAFYKIIIAIYELIRLTKQTQELLVLIKTIDFLDACVSIVAVQCALLTMQQSFAASQSSALLGIGVSFLFMIIGFMLNHKKY